MKPAKIILIPHDSVNDEEVLIISLTFAEGDFARKGETILEYETSKAVMSVELEVEGFIAYRCAEGESVRVGAAVAAVFAAWDTESVADWRAAHEEQALPTATPQAESAAPAATLYSARAEAMMAKQGVDKKLFAGRDFVSIQDVEQVLGKVAPPPSSPAGTPIRKRPQVAGITNDQERIVVICANQIAAEVIQDIVDCHDQQVVVGYVVDAQYRAQADLPYLDANVFDFPERIDRHLYDSVILAMGGSLRSMRFRKKVFEHYRSHDISFTNVISSTANIAGHVTFGSGNIIEGSVYIGTHTVVGDNNFISYATIIGHHNVVGSHNLFAPGVTMAGLVTIGDDCILPTGVNFIDRVQIGHRIILPVGYNVISDLKDDTVVKIKSTD